MRCYERDCIRSNEEFGYSSRTCVPYGYTLYWESVGKVL